MSEDKVAEAITTLDELACYLESRGKKRLDEGGSVAAAMDDILKSVRVRDMSQYLRYYGEAGLWDDFEDG